MVARTAARCRAGFLTGAGTAIMNETIANGDRYADFRNDPSYERRVVIFYDSPGLA